MNIRSDVSRRNTDKLKKRQEFLERSWNNTKNRTNVYDYIRREIVARNPDGTLDDIQPISIGRFKIVGR